MISTGELTLKVMKEASWYNEWLFSLVNPHCRGEILEIGSGIGNFTDLLLKKGNVTAIDIDKKYIDLFKTRRSKGLQSGYGDIEKNKFFFKDKKFDTIICLNVLEHIKEDNKALANMFSLLNKKGKLILLVPAHKLLFSKFDTNLGHFRRYNVAGTDEKLELSGFKYITSRYINWWAAIGWYIFLKIFKKEQLPDQEVKIFNYLGKFLLWPEKFIKFPFGLSVLAIAEKNKLPSQ